ncbi:MAG: hypothetical protein ACR2P4_05160 [Gammaproteobacteria bacterium]
MATTTGVIVYNNKKNTAQKRRGKNAESARFCVMISARWNFLSPDYR